MDTKYPQSSSLVGTAPNALAPVSYAFGGDVVAVGGKVAMMPIELGTADFMVHHIHAFTIHVTAINSAERRTVMLVTLA